MDESTGFEFSTHEIYGQKLKVIACNLEQIRADLVSTYKKSSIKEARQLEAAIEKIKLVQTSLHGRLLREYEEKDDDELLPVYLGRLASN
jgi:hypothetical protein